ncbi:response regulator transcription factor [bacterium]|nr:response regulator transcription factor [bacterium]
MSNADSIRVLIIDDHEMVRKGLIYFLASQPNFEVVGEAGSAIEGIDLVDQLKPDIVLIDLVMPNMSGLETIKIIKTKHSNIELLAITSYIDDQKVHAALRNGASGYMMKDSSPLELARAIRIAAKGEVYLHPEAARRLASSLRTTGESDPLPDVLSDREIEVVKLIARGLSNQDIADDLNISVKTVKSHVSSILSKLMLESRVQIALYALRHYIVQLEDI